MIWYATLITGSNKRPHHCSIPIHCVRMEQSGSTHASTHSCSAAAGAYAHYYGKLIKEGMKREKKRTRRSWEVEKKTKQGHQDLMTTSACPIQLRSLRAKIPFQEAGKEGVRQRMKEGDAERQADDRPLPVYLFCPSYQQSSPRATGHSGVDSLMGCPVLVCCYFLFSKCYFLKESQNNTYNIGSGLI